MLQIHKLLSLALIVVLTIATPMQTAIAQQGPHKYALIVGIDHYGVRFTKDVPAGEQWSALDGSSNDAKALGEELQRRGFEVMVVTNEQATHKGIVDAFRKQLIEKDQAGRNDVVLFHYSGHGQQIPDDNGTPDESDGYDEAIIPYDNKGTKDYSNHIRDDEIGILVKELREKTSNIVISLDSCHSGTATRGAGARKKRGGAPAHPPAKLRGNDTDSASGMMAKGDAEGAGFVFRDRACRSGGQRGPR